MTRSGLSVVIPTRDRPEFLDGCLKTLKTSVSSVDEVIVVDSASKDRSIEAIAAAHGARYVRCEKPGASRARNAGWRAATNGFVAFIDDDVRVSDDWAAAFVRCFEGYPEASFISGMVGIPPGEDPELPTAHLDREDAFEIRPRTEDPGHTANLAVRKRALELVNGFDELLGPGTPFHAAEDRDLIDRLFAANLTGRYEPSAKATHVAWRERPDIVGVHWSYGIGTGARIRKLLRAKNRERLKDVTWESFMNWGVRDLNKHARGHEFFLCLVDIVRMTAMGLGLVRAFAYRVEDGHLRRLFRH